MNYLVENKVHDRWNVSTKLVTQTRIVMKVTNMKATKVPRKEEDIRLSWEIVAAEDAIRNNKAKRIVLLGTQLLTRHSRKEKSISLSKVNSRSHLQAKAIIINELRKAKQTLSLAQQLLLVWRTSKAAVSKMPLTGARIAVCPVVKNVSSLLRRRTPWEGKNGQPAS